MTPQHRNLRIVQRARTLAGLAWEDARHVLRDTRLAPSAAELAALAAELGAPTMTALERQRFAHAYRSELHSLNIVQELRRMGVVAPEDTP